MHRTLLLSGCLVLVLLLLLMEYREAYCDTPRIIKNFLTQDECQQLIAEVEKTKCLTRSEVKDETQARSSARTSSTCFLENDVPIASLVKHKVFALTGIPMETYEDVQVVKYTPGQKYDAHYDNNDGDPLDEVRTKTVLMYLNDNFTGGETAFPHADHVVTPEQGMAVLWENVDEQGTSLPCAFHEARPVKEGVKYACTVWIRGLRKKVSEDI